MSMNRVRLTPKDLRGEIRDWQNDHTQLLRGITPQVEELRKRVEGLRDLMAPFDAKFVAAVEALTEVTMQLYMIVNSRAALDGQGQAQIENRKRPAEEQLMGGAH